MSSGSAKTVARAKTSCDGAGGWAAAREADAAAIARSNASNSVSIDVAAVGGLGGAAGLSSSSSSEGIGGGARDGSEKKSAGNPLGAGDGSVDVYSGIQFEDVAASNVMDELCASCSLRRRCQHPSPLEGFESRGQPFASPSWLAPFLRSLYGSCSPSGLSIQLAC